MTQTWNKNKIRKEMGYGTWGKGGRHGGGKVEGMVGKRCKAWWGYKAW